MIIYIYYVIIFLLTVAATYLIFKKTKNTLLYSATTIFLSCAFWMFPRFFYERQTLGLFIRTFNSIAYSLNNSILIFGLGGELKEVRALKELLIQIGTSSIFALIVSFVAALFYFLAPIVTVSAIVSLFRERFSVLKYRWFSLYKKQVYIFSELNERSITLAKDIVLNKNSNEDKKERLIVFCDVFSHNSESSFELQEQASEIGAICLINDIAIVNWIKTNIKRKSKKETEKSDEFYKFFLIGENENENLEQIIKLINKYDKTVEKDTVTLYLFSKSSTSELSTQSLLSEDSTVNIIRVDYKRSMIYNYLYENGADIINRVSKKPGRRFNMLILGMGEHGFEMIKSLLWFCQRTGYELKIDVYDKEKDIKERFYAQCPGIRTFSDKNTSIIFHPETDFNNSGFYDDSIGKHTDSDFVFISLGDDSENIALAKRVREVFARKNIEGDNKETATDNPIITTVVENSQVKAAMKKNNYNIQIIGDFESVYSNKVIINSDLERIALAVHRHDTGNADSKDITTYKRQEFYNEYYYRSTMAQVIYHLVWKESNGVKECSWEKLIEDLSNNESTLLKTINDIEHVESNKWIRHYEEDVYKNDREKWDNKENWSAFILREHSFDELDKCYDKLKKLYKRFDDDIKPYEECFADEKNRWNYYELTEGFEIDTSKKYSGDMKVQYHRHPLIKPFDELSKEEREDELTGMPQLSDKQGEAKYFTEAYWILLKQYEQIKQRYICST